VLINAFFLYSFLGWCMECVVIRRERGVWENRGFARSPFCVIYGFGAMLGFAVLRPVADNYVALYLVGAVLATLLEYITARVMLRLFGSLWWDYSNKPFNYKGILCLESTLGWGLIALLVFSFLHSAVFAAAMRLPASVGGILALCLLGGYTTDFFTSALQALHTEHSEGVRQSTEPSADPARF
jgi:uncharacterized membrane protein